jgi:hypothetical protein
MLAKWSKAPSWAKWLAVDSDAVAHFFETKPTRFGDCWQCGGRSKTAGRCRFAGDWRNAIEQRPRK